MRQISPLLVVLFFALAGCGMPLSEAEMQQSPEGILLRQIVDEISAKDFQALKRQFDPAVISRPDFEITLASLAVLVPRQASKSITFTSWEFTTVWSGERTSSVTADYEYPDLWLQVTISTRSETERLLVESIVVQQIEQAAIGVNL